MLSRCLLCADACMHACMHTHMHIYIHACIHTYMHACIHTYIHTYIHAYIHTYMHACMHACMHAYIHKTSLPLSLWCVCGTRGASWARRANSTECCAISTAVTSETSPPPPPPIAETWGEAEAGRGAACKGSGEGGWSAEVIVTSVLVAQRVGSWMRQVEWEYCRDPPCRKDGQ